MVPRPAGAVLRLVCLLAYQPRLVSATYSCSAIGIECLNRIYVGSYATEAAAKAAPDHIADAYGIARRNYYFRLADARPALRKFARSRAGGKGGWIRRAEEFIAPRFHLSAAEFRHRVAAW